MPRLAHVFTSACLALVGAACLATPAYFKVFSATYPNSPALKNRCLNCHLGRPPKRNPYGKAVDNIVLGGTLTSAMLHQLDNVDSDGDGYTNLEEINAGTLPGDPTSHPVAHNAAPVAQPLIPTHSEHPPIVHFPIALFLFGTFLELVGIWKKKPELGVAAAWNLWFAFISSIAAVGTGLTASYRLGYGLPPTGQVLTHMILGLSTFALMGLTLWFRARKWKAYLVVLIFAAIAVSATGYLGGLIVYGS